MRLHFIAALLLVIVLAGCQGPPPTMVIMIITTTPNGESAATPSPGSTNTVSASPATTEVQLTPTPSATSTPDPRPTAVLGEIQVAEQVFESGRMFWIQPRGQIWVMFDDGAGRGEWAIYEDTFADGDPESDPSIIPPEGMYQPTRGFGMLWRNTAGIRDRLGFGLTPEFGYVSSYEYHQGGNLGSDGTWQAGPGHHILFSLYNERFQFNETDSTWEKLS
jgi:hypothetical protein